MFFKELACFILFSYQCSFAVLINVVRDSFHILSCVLNFVNNFFQLFLIRFCSFEEGIENLSFYVVSCCRSRQLDQIITGLFICQQLFSTFLF